MEHPINNYFVANNNNKTIINKCKDLKISKPYIDSNTVMNITS